MLIKLSYERIIEPIKLYPGTSKFLSSDGVFQILQMSLIHKNRHSLPLELFDD